jgi:catechol 2,3-dioxygenase-like lactoylglutathione lyase family enzyme
VGEQRYFLLVLRAAAGAPNKTASGNLLPPCALPQHNGRGPGHIAFGVSTDALDSWRARLTKEGVEILSEVKWERGARSLYFRDPDGHMIEPRHSRNLGANVSPF